MNDFNEDKPTIEARDKMLEILDRFEREGNVRVPLGMSVNGESSYRQEHPAIGQFVQLAYEDEWMLPGFDWGHWDEGRKIASDVEKIAQCDFLTIRRLITALVRNERFCEGALQSAYEGGVLQAIIRRIMDLTNE